MLTKVRADSLGGADKFGSVQVLLKVKGIKREEGELFRK